MINRFRFIKQAMYRLRQRYGTRIRLIKRLSLTIDRETGVKTATYANHLTKIILLPNLAEREFAYPLAVIAASKQFVHGGFFKDNERQLIFDKKSLRLPDGTYWELALDQWFSYGGKRFNIAEITQFEEAQAWLVRAKGGEGEDVESELDTSITDEVAIDDSGLTQTEAQDEINFVETVDVSVT